jgi:hypothetical protein
MKATFEIEFESEKEADDSLKIIQSQEGKNAMLHVLHKKGAKSVLYIIEAKAFSPLRARSTSLLRDIKIMKNVFEKSQPK